VRVRIDVADGATNPTVSDEATPSSPTSARLAPKAAVSSGRPVAGPPGPLSGTAAQAFKKPMKIGQLARKTGKTVRALHLYEELGLLAPDRSDGGFRLYGPDELARVYWISKLQDMGFKLSQIRGLLDAVAASNSAPEAMHGVRELFQSKLRDTREQIQKLLTLERDIAESLSYLEACRGCGEATTKSCAECGEDRHGGIPEPKLVSGIHLNRAGDAPAQPAHPSSDSEEASTP
jgi:MerR family transcriptional regulator, copper efflux regulator